MRGGFATRGIFLGSDPVQMSYMLDISSDTMLFSRSCQVIVSSTRCSMVVFAVCLFLRPTVYFIGSNNLI